MTRGVNFWQEVDEFGRDGFGMRFGIRRVARLSAFWAMGEEIGMEKATQTGCGGEVEREDPGRREARCAE